MPTAALILFVCLAVVLLTGGTAKIRSGGSAAELDSLGVPKFLQQGWLVRLHPWAEIALGLSLLVTSGWLLVGVALAAAALLAFYLVLVVRVVRRGEEATCDCFGSLVDSRLTRRTVARNAALTSLAAVVAGAALAGYSVPGIVRSQASSLFAVVAAVVVALVTWLVLVPSSVTSVPAADVAAGLDDELDDYLRAPIPFVRVATSQGAHVALRDLASEKARLLVFMSTTCGSCADLAGPVRAWIDEFDMIEVHPVFLSTPEMTAAKFPELTGSALFDPDQTASQTFGLNGVPAAVLLGADGLLAGGPVVGQNGVIELVDQMRAELTAAAVPLDS